MPVAECLWLEVRVRLILSLVFLLVSSKSWAAGLPVTFDSEYGQAIKKLTAYLNTPEDHKNFKRMLRMAAEDRADTMVDALRTTEQVFIAHGWTECKGPMVGFQFYIKAATCFFSAVANMSSWINQFMMAPEEIQALLYTSVERAGRDIQRQPYIDPSVDR
jgi:hypothetical protein